MNADVNIELRLSAIQYSLLDRYCKARGVGIEEVIRAAIDRYLVVAEQALSERVARKQLAELIPYDKIVEAYHEELPMLPSVRLLSKHLKAAIRARWFSGRERQNLQWWRDYFRLVAGCKFLLGVNDREWRADLMWLVGPRNMEKILNGRYSDRKQGGLSQRVAGSIGGLIEWIEEKQNGN